MVRSAWFDLIPGRLLNEDQHERMVEAAAVGAVEARLLRDTNSRVHLISFVVLVGGYQMMDLNWIGLLLSGSQPFARSLV